MADGDFLKGVRRGLAGRCPNCGEGRLFRRYLKVAECCPACAHDNGRYRADDFPAYLTILLVGHLVIAPVLALEVLWSYPPFLVTAVSLPLLAVLTLLLLPVIKGAVVGLHWALGVRNPSQ